MYVIMIRTGRGWRPMNQPRSSEPRTFATQHDAWDAARSMHPCAMREQRMGGRVTVSVEPLSFHN